jgi:hypothetical protein
VQAQLGFSKPKRRTPIFDAKRFYEEQIEYLVTGRTDELIDAHYHADAVLLSLETVIQSNEALKKHFREYVKKHGPFCRDW